MKNNRNNRQKQTIIAFTLSMLLLVFDDAHSADIAGPSSAIRSLVGVKTVRVIVENFSPSMQQTGLRKEQLIETVAEALRKAGFVVLGAREFGKVPLVYVRLSSVFANDEGSGPISFYMSLQLKQPAALLSEGHPDTSAVKPADTGESPLIVTTWEGGTMAMVNGQELFFYVKQTLLNLVGDLARDHQEANTQQISQSR